MSETPSASAPEARTYDIRIGGIGNDNTGATPGSVFIGPWSFASYAHYWSQVGDLVPEQWLPAIHDQTRARLVWELERAGGEVAEILRKRIAEYDTYVTMLHETAPMVAARFDQLAEWHTPIPHFGGPDRYNYAAAHTRARAVT